MNREPFWAYLNYSNNELLQIIGDFYGLNWKNIDIGHLICLRYHMKIDFLRLSFFCSPWSILYHFYLFYSETPHILISSSKKLSLRKYILILARKSSKLFIPFRKYTHKNSKKIGEDVVRIIITYKLVKLSQVLFLKKKKIEIN